MSIIGNSLFIGGSGGGDKPILLVTVTGQTATAVTATKSGASVSLAYDSTLGKWWAVLPSTGTWTVTATNASRTDSKAVSVTDTTLYPVELYMNPFLPDGYVEVEYIESTGTQYINTGYVSLTNGLFYRVKGWMWENISSEQYIAGTHGIGTNNNNNRNIFGLLSGKWDLGAGNSTNTGTVPQLSVKYEIEASTLKSDPYLEIDGSVIVRSTDKTTNREPISLFVLAMNFAGTAYGKTIGKMYGGIDVFSDAGTTKVLSLIPAKRKSDSVIGMYDAVRNQFLTNAGTGSFIGGPEV